MNLKNIEILNECRDEYEIKQSLKSFGLNLTNEELDGLKANLGQNNENCSALNNDQLDEVAGGMLELRAYYDANSRLNFQGLINSAKGGYIKINVTYNDGHGLKVFQSYLSPGNLERILSDDARMYLTHKWEMTDTGMSYARDLEGGATYPTLPTSIAFDLFNGIRSIYSGNNPGNYIRAGESISSIDGGGTLTISPVGENMRILRTCIPRI